MGQGSIIKVTHGKALLLKNVLPEQDVLPRGMFVSRAALSPAFGCTRYPASAALSRDNWAVCRLHRCMT